jgi:hypothetical protein
MNNIINRLVKRILIKLSNYKDKQEMNSYLEGIRLSFNKLVNKKELTKEQKKEIQDFYSNLLGYHIPLDYHKYFTSRTGIYSKLYFPTSIYKTDIVGRLNVYPLKRAYTDKNISDIILPNIHQPKVFLKNMNGYFYFEGKPVDRNDAIQLCSNLGEVIIKPSLTGRGIGVSKITIQNGLTNLDEKSIQEVFDVYKEDFLIEELVHQHPLMTALNPSSINTIRIVTYRNDMEIVVVYTVIRIGRKDKPIDNESAGGISTIINQDGTLGKYAYGSPGNDNIEFTDSGVRLEGYMIPSFSNAIDMVKKAHYQLPYFKLMGWDIAIEEDGTPTMIEFNTTPDLSQSANGPAFGEYTEMILKEAKSRNNTWSRIALECMWKKNNLLK